MNANTKIRNKYKFLKYTKTSSKKKTYLYHFTGGNETSPRQWRELLGNKSRNLYCEKSKEKKTQEQMANSVSNMQKTR
jgi:hypothetical protein